MRLDRLEELRKLLNSFVDYQVILPHNDVKTPVKYAVLGIVNIDKSVFNTPRKIDNIKVTFLSVTALLQLDFYSKDQLEAQKMCIDMINKLIYINRKDLLRAGFGLKEKSIDFQNLTFIENSKYIYRFSFDVNITWNEEVARNVTIIEDVPGIKYENEENERR